MTRPSRSWAILHGAVREFVAELEPLRRAFQAMGDALTDPVSRSEMRRLRAYHARVARPRSPLSSKHRAGSRANKHRRTVPTFASDRRTR